MTDPSRHQPALLQLDLDVPREPRRIVRCKVCHRPLRDADSRAVRTGPGCHDQITPRRDWDVEQEELPGL